MSRFVRAGACALVLSLAATAPGVAAEPAGPAGATSPSATAVDCARRYNEAMHIEDTMASVMRSMMPMMIDQYRGVDQPDQTRRERLVVDAIVEVSRDMMPEIMDALAPVMAATFTEAEVCGLADFYGSAVGQGIVDKMPAFSTASAGVMSEQIPKLQLEMMRRICAKIDCGVAADPKKAPSKAS